MVATWNPAASSSYYTQQTEYYLTGEEPAGWWYCPSGQLGIGDATRVEKQRFAQLFAGIGPDGQLLLPAHSRRADRVPAFDVTLSAPRSVTLLWAFGNAKTRTAIEQAQARATRATLVLLEREAAFARRGRGGIFFERTALTAACFQHGESRPAKHTDGRFFADGNLHSHCIILNLSTTSGRVGAIHSTVLRDWKMAAGATYHAALAHEMQALGFGIDRLDYNGVFEIAGIDDQAIDYFSARRNEIKDELTHADTTSIEAPALAAAIAKSTRSGKLECSSAEQKLVWTEAARANGIALDQLEQRAREAARTHLKHSAREQLVPDWIAKLAAELTDKRSVFDRRELVRATTAALVGCGLTPEQITQTIDQLVERGNVVALGQDNIGQVRYSTPQRIQIERSVVATTARLSQAAWHRIDTASIQRHCTEHKLSAEQTIAAISACASNRIAVIEGAPGVGKTTTLAPIVEAYREAGCKVIGGAQAWRIATMLRDDLAVESRATASWLHRADNDQPFLDPRTLLVIDEAGLLSSEDTHTLLQAVERSGAKLLLVGDRAQLQAIGGAAGLPLVTRAVDHARVSTIVRQRDGWARDAIAAFGRGDAEQALTAFALRGQVIETKGTRAALQAIGNQWAQLRQQHPNTTTLLLAKTNAEVMGIGREIRTRLRAEGLVHGPDINVRTATPSGHTAEITLAAGDQIRFLTRCDKLGVINGSTGTVVGVSSPTTITQDQSQQCIEAEVGGKRIKFSPADLADDKGRARLSWGYASTIFGAQGLTVDHSVVLISPTFDRHDAYVAASRSRHRTVLITDTNAIDSHVQLSRAPAANGRAATVTDHERQTWLAKQLSRASVKESTLDVIELDHLSRTAHQTRARQRKLEAEVTLER